MNIRGYYIGPRADLNGANLRGANFSGVNLRCANVNGADLNGADLRCAILSKADLRGADLRGANLMGTDLRSTDLRGARLANTVLDPANKPNGGSTDWPKDSEILRGYRSRTQPVMGGPAYEIGKQYVAPYFSTCARTSCHPGLYVEPKPDNIKNCIVVEFRREDLHSAGKKHRVRKFTVLEESR